MSFGLLTVHPSARPRCLSTTTNQNKQQRSKLRPKTTRFSRILPLLVAQQRGTITNQHHNPYERNLQDERAAEWQGTISKRERCENNLLSTFAILTGKPRLKKQKKKNQKYGKSNCRERKFRLPATNCATKTTSLTKIRCQRSKKLDFCFVCLFAFLLLIIFTGGGAPKPPGFLHFAFVLNNRSRIINTNVFTQNRHHQRHHYHNNNLLVTEIEFASTIDYPKPLPNRNSTVYQNQNNADENYQRIYFTQAARQNRRQPSALSSREQRKATKTDDRWRANVINDARRRRLLVVVRLRCPPG
jgi:hypothetical protein